MRQMSGRSARSSSRLLLGGALGLALALAPTAAPAVGEAQVPTLTLVTLTGPGTSAGGDEGAAQLLARQHKVLRSVDGGQPVYRWTTALNGFAAELTSSQVAELSADPDVASVETNEVRPLAGRRPALRGIQDATRSPRLRGGSGVVVGVVDSGIGPESSAFAAVPGLGRDPESFAGSCEAGAGWSQDTCNRKLVGARWFVDGFGTTRVRSSESLSPRDVLGHGSQVASLAAGNAGVTVRVDNRDAGQFGGVAPQARIASYKACWGAPDPSDDGCSTADLVSAVDSAVTDGVDVLNLSVSGGSGIDTLQRALLGAAEADVVVVGASGNTARQSYAAHAAPWVTTVGAAVGSLARGSVQALGGPRLDGGGGSRAVKGRLVPAGQAGAPGADARETRQCRPGSLDARQVAGTIVICERGGIGRIDKSDAVAQADGIGMVLVNVRPGGVTTDFHAVPTVHLTARDGHRLERWATSHPQGRVELGQFDAAPSSRRAAPWSAVGDPRGPVVKPDAVADGSAALGALPEATGRTWGLFSGTSAAAAHASGLAALIRSQHDWSASAVRSVLVSTADPLPRTSVLKQGSGSLAGKLPTAHLALDVPPGQWRRALESGRFADLNTSSVLLSLRSNQTSRTLTNIGSKAEYFSVTTRGFDAHRVAVRPLAVRLAPGESARFRITVSGPTTPGRLDDGYLVWRGARGGVTRLPVALTR